MRFNFKGITKRWIINGLGTVILFLALIVVAFTLITRNYYYRNMESSLQIYANTSMKIFERYQEDNASNLEVALRDYVLNFDDKELVELQLINKDGMIVLTSSGFERNDEIAPEWEKISSSPEKTAIWKGKSSLGEGIMSICVKMGDSYGLRYVSSLKLVEGQIRNVSLIGVLAALIVLFFVMLSNSYFVSSIINPMKEIGRSARSIALGNYTVRIEKRYNDEIGDLCDTINYMAGELGDSEKLQNEFISSVSHELRTPLTSIKGWSETLCEIGIDDPAMTRQGLEAISNESDRLARIVEDLLDFSRMQNGRFSIRLEKMDLLVEIEDTVMLYRERAKKENKRLKYVEYPYPTLIIEGDKFRIRQVLVNILDNAFKYSNSGDSVRLEVADMGADIQLVVSDTGIGISQEKLPHITDKFYRASKDGGIPGSGIGLAVVKEIVDAHRGTLEVESIEGEGTTVIVTLPKKPDKDGKDQDE
ncbi:MAG: HAMP domain-containing histidine kinase [Clostridia bacterium]|nr:HAMP domain-containing histidine kinase [Clostridia bacterium]